MGNRNHLNCLNAFLDSIESSDSFPIRFSEFRKISGLSYTTIHGLCKEIKVIAEFLDKFDLSTDFENRLIHLSEDKKTDEWQIIGLSLASLKEDSVKILGLLGEKQNGQS